MVKNHSMNTYTKMIFYLCFFIILSTPANEYKYILNERSLNEIYLPAIAYFKDTDINVIKIPQGIILRFFITDIVEEYYEITSNTMLKINKIKNFLANFQNPVIIEVHTERTLPNTLLSLKKWEVSTVIANNIEKMVKKLNINSDKKIRSVGYGEFLPMKNTPNNGGKSLNRVDIIVLCEISGE